MRNDDVELQSWPTFFFSSQVLLDRKTYIGAKKVRTFAGDGVDAHILLRKKFEDDLAL
jgi:hypothetical protein